MKQEIKYDTFKIYIYLVSAAVFHAPVNVSCNEAVLMRWMELLGMHVKCRVFKFIPRPPTCFFFFFIFCSDSVLLYQTDFVHKRIEC